MECEKNILINRVNMFKKSIVIIFIGIALSCNSSTKEQKRKIIMNTQKKEKLELATFGNGCFWCTEAIFRELKGVATVEAGYAGGAIKSTSYKEVCTGTTGHAEVIQIAYDPTVISYLELVDVFFNTHDPTTLNRQGADVGTQYRSVIFYHTEKQKETAEKMILELEKQKIFENKVLTEVMPIHNYSSAEKDHQDYYNNNKNQGYCQMVIHPKLQKFTKKYRAKLKDN